MHSLQEAEVLRAANSSLRGLLSQTGITSEKVQQYCPGWHNIKIRGPSSDLCFSPKHTVFGVGGDAATDFAFNKTTLEVFDHNSSASNPNIVRHRVNTTFYPAKDCEGTQISSQSKSNKFPLPRDSPQTLRPTPTFPPPYLFPQRLNPSPVFLHLLNFPHPFRYPPSPASSMPALIRIFSHLSPIFGVLEGELGGVGTGVILFVVPVARP
jgi:hypothetical protein